MENIHIVITRPTIIPEDIPAWEEKISMNVDFIPLPLLSFKRIDSEAVRQSIEKIRLTYYDILIFLSSNAVNIFFEILQEQSDFNSLLNILANKEIIAIGPKTMQSLSKYGIISEFPNSSNNYSISEINYFLSKLNEENKRKNNKESSKILIPRSAESVKSKNLIEKKLDTIILDQVFFYEIERQNNIDNFKRWKKIMNLTKKTEKTYIVFTSPSAVRSFFKDIVLQFPYLSNKTDKVIINYMNVHAVLSIGPKTSNELKIKEIDFVESPVHTLKGVLELIYRSI